MACKSASNYLIIVLSIIFLSTTSITGFNITRMLDRYDDYSTFNNLLTQTQVASAINNRQSITVLVVGNSGMSSVAQKTQNAISYILASHVLLDYYDELKIANLAGKKGGVKITTLLQTSGIANNNQGQCNLTVSSSGTAVFGSAVKGAQHDSQMIKVEASQAGNISLIHISTPIVVPGLMESVPPASGPTSFNGDDVTPKKDADTPAPSPDSANSPSDDPADAPNANSPSDDPADSPKASKHRKHSGEADGGQDGDDDDVKAKMKTNGETKVVVVGGGAVAATLLGFVGLRLLF